MKIYLLAFGPQLQLSSLPKIATFDREILY
jgi:hypothetical protein